MDLEMAKLIIVTLFLAAGSFFLITGALGIVRFPDTYSRMHAAGKCDTLGLSLMLIGFIIYQGIDLISVKLLMIVLFVFFTGPVAVNAIIRAALTTGHKMWTVEGWKEWRKERKGETGDISG